MLEFDISSAPRSPDEMVDVTRENGRNLDHYQDILVQNKLPKLTPVPGATYLEIGTGLGNAIPGIFSLTGNTGKVVSIDINQSTLELATRRLKQFYSQARPPASLINDVGIAPPKEKADISLFLGDLPDPLPPGVTLVQADISADFALPPNTFDQAISIWVFYQIL